MSQTAQLTSIRLYRGYNRRKYYAAGVCGERRITVVFWPEDVALFEAAGIDVSDWRGEGRPRNRALAEPITVQVDGEGLIWDLVAVAPKQHGVKS